jgi:pimeloyl-ACP methyl ester carboxylesterase
MPSEAHTPHPPVPSLEGHWLKTVGHGDRERGTLEAFRPVAPEHTCRNEEAPALVCVPGLGMDGNCFLRQLPLGRCADLHFLRPPGYAARGEHGLGHFAHYIERYIRSLGLERRGVILMGSSMGGAVSLLVALRRKVGLRGLVMVGSCGHHRHLSAHQRRLARSSWILPGFLITFVAGSMLRTSSAFGRFSRDEADFMLSCVRIPSHGYLVRATTALQKLDLLDDARHLDLPTLIVHGTDDRVLPFEAGCELAQTIPGAEWAEIRDAGHALFFLDHEAVNEKVAGFVTRVALGEARKT